MPSSIEHGRDLARDFRGHGRLAPRDDVARRVQHGGGLRAAAPGRRRDGRRELDLDGLRAQRTSTRRRRDHGARARARRPSREPRTTARLGASRSIFRLSRVFWSSDTSIPPRTRDSSYATGKVPSHVMNYGRPRNLLRTAYRLSRPGTAARCCWRRRALVEQLPRHVADRPRRARRAIRCGSPLRAPHGRAVAEHEPAVRQPARAAPRP